MIVRLYTQLGLYPGNAFCYNRQAGRDDEPRIVADDRVALAVMGRLSVRIGVSECRGEYQTQTTIGKPALAELELIVLLRLVGHPSSSRLARSLFADDHRRPAPPPRYPLRQRIPKLCLAYSSTNLRQAQDVHPLGCQPDGE